MSAKLGRCAFFLSWLIILQGCVTTYKLYDRDTPSRAIVVLTNEGAMGPENKFLTSGVGIVESIDEKVIFEKSVFDLSQEKSGSGYLQRMMISPGHHDLLVRFYVTRAFDGPSAGSGKRLVTEYYNLSSLTKSLSFDAKPRTQYVVLAWGRSSVTDPKWNESWYVWIQEKLNPWIWGDVVAGESPSHVQEAIASMNENWRKKGK